MAKQWEFEPVFCLTSDIDWASEEVIKYSHRLISEFRVPITYFITHPSPYISALVDSGDVDVGIHPNFLGGSSQGSTFEEVINYCVKLAPEAKGFRCHKYFEVDDTNDALFERGFRYDSNLCTLLEPGLRPFVHRSRLVRFPIFFEDGAYVKYGLPFDPHFVVNKLMSAPGIYIFNVHPIHIALNTPDFAYTRSVKDSLSQSEYRQIDEDKLRKLRNSKAGIGSMLLEILEIVKTLGVATKSLEQLYAEYHNDEL